MSTTHEERTSADSRDARVHTVVLHRIDQVNADIRLLQLRKKTPGDQIKFRPGQWLDVFVPGVRNAGGFTITSTPQDERGCDGYLELAIQKSPRNPPAAWLWQDKEKIQDRELKIRTGGNFIWPPPNIDDRPIQKVVFVAGGVGINPLISIATHLQQTNSMPPVRFLYSIRNTCNSLDSILFFPRLRQFLAQASPNQNHLTLFLTGGSTGDPGSSPSTQVEESASSASCERESKHEDVKDRRMEYFDLLDSIQGPSGVVVYICGPPQMTDWAAQTFTDMGMPPDRVLTEKWW